VVRQTTSLFTPEAFDLSNIMQQFLHFNLETAPENMEKRYLNILVCPNCKGLLNYDVSAQELICELDKLAYLVKDGIPVMLIEEARQISSGPQL